MVLLPRQPCCVVTGQLVRNEGLPGSGKIVHVALRSGIIILPAVLHKRVIPCPGGKRGCVIDGVRLRPGERVRSGHEGQVVPRVQIFQIAA